MSEVRVGGEVAADCCLSPEEDRGEVAADSRSMPFKGRGEGEERGGCELSCDVRKWGKCRKGKGWGCRALP